MRRIRTLVVAAATLSLLIVGIPPGTADHEKVLRPKLSKLKWDPAPDLADLDNWETYNAYNVIHYVSTNLTNRQPDDQTDDDPEGDPNPQCFLLGDLDPPGGLCTYNHQLEYLDWWENAYRKILGPFGVTFRTYEFEAPGSTGGNLATNAGRAFNKLAIIPGADHPEDLVLIGSHYDQVDGSPYAAWDQTAGTGIMLRTAKYLADYWKATGTRPSNTYVFAAWDAEESGSNGSEHYIGTESVRGIEDGTLPKDPEVRVTAYLNHDPCGVHYPAMYRGLPVSRNPAVEKTGFIPMSIALHNPGGTPEEIEQMAAFNDMVPGIIHRLFNYIDDTLPLVVADVPVELPVFVSTSEAVEMGAEVLEQESVIKLALGGLLLFGTDAEAMHAWIPTFNPFPDFVGPHANPNGPEDLGWSADALFAIHSPLDHFEEMVRLTSLDQTGMGYSKGLAMSYEFCSILSTWVMLQPTVGGTQVATDDVVAFWETPNPNVNGGEKTFDASGSYVYTDIKKRKIKTKGLLYSWDFGDGTKVKTKDPVITHKFKGLKSRFVSLTVTDPATGKSDSMAYYVGVSGLPGI